MATFGDLLGSFLQGNATQSAPNRMGNALQDLQSGLGADLSGRGGAGGLLGALLEGAQGALGQASQNPMQAGGLGAVLGSVLGGGGDSIKGALTGGALAMLAGVAYKALSGAGQDGLGATASQPGFSGGELPLGLKPPMSEPEQQALEERARLVVKGMINIAKSDGHVGVDEIQRIVDRVEAAGMDDEAQRWLMRELDQPLDLDAFVAEIPNREVAAEVYAASLLAVEVDTQEERDYLRALAEKTGLHPVVVRHIHQSLGVSL